MENVIKLLKNRSLPLLFCLISKEDFYPLKREGISVYRSKRKQTGLAYSFPADKHIAKVLDIKNGKIL